MPDLPYSPDQVGERIRRTREALGFERPADFARVLGVLPQELSAWETGVRRPSIAKIMPMVRQYHLTLDWIFLGDPSNLPHKVARLLLAPEREVSPPNRD